MHFLNDVIFFFFYIFLRRLLIFFLSQVFFFFLFFWFQSNFCLVKLCSIKQANGIRQSLFFLLHQSNTSCVCQLIVYKIIRPQEYLSGFFFFFFVIHFRHFFSFSSERGSIHKTAAYKTRKRISNPIFCWGG